MPKKTVVIVGSLDTKGDEFAFVKKLIEAEGLNTLVVDFGVMGAPALEPDITREEVAKAGGRAWLRLPEHEVVLTGQQQGQVDALLDKFIANPTAPPSFKDATAEVGEDLMQMLLSRGDLVAVSGDVVFENGAYGEMVETVRAHLGAEGSITVAQARDMFDTSRKYALALLEYLDQISVTKRVGDERVAGRAT